MRAYAIDGVQRPLTRAECIDGPRPCPWVSCRYHLLIEIAKHAPKADEHGSKRDARPTTIRLNRATGVLGRRTGLSASAAAEIVRAWIRDAVEYLEQMEWTCALDVADAHPDGIQLTTIGDLLGVTTAAIKQEMACARVLRDGMHEYADHVPDDHAGNLARVGGRA